MTVKTEEIKKEVTETVTKYVAKDGTEFNDKNQCEQYEQTMRCVFATRLRSCMKRIEKDDMFKKGLDCLLDDGMARSDYYKITPKTDEDVTNLVAFLKAAYSSEDSDSYNVYRLNFDKLKKDETYLFVNIDDCEYSFITSYEKIMSSLKSGWNFLMEDEKKEEEKGE